MIEQAAEQHDKFAATSSNNMIQCKKNVQNLVSNKPQEPRNVTETWTENCKQSVKHIFDKQGKMFERKCQDIQRTENKKAAKFQSNQEKKLQTTAGKTESELSNQAQSLLDQPPMDMGEVTQELEMEAREHGNKAQQGMEAATRKPLMTTQAQQAGVINGRDLTLNKQTEQWDADLKAFDQEWDNLFLDMFTSDNGEPEPTPKTNSKDNNRVNKPTTKIYSKEKHKGCDTKFSKTSGLGISAEQMTSHH
jgi:hypothetical protein